MKSLNHSIILESLSHKQPLDEVDELEKDIQSKLNKDITIPKDVLDSFMIKDTLNPEIWSNKQLISKVKTTLLKLAKDFFKDIDVPSEVEIKDIIFTGSLANYNWSKFSDIDLHIVIDFKDLEADPKLIEDFFYAQKTIWNENHNVTIFDYPIELYVQDINHKLVATAVYSVMNDEWIKEPSDVSFKLDKKAITLKANDYIKQLKDIRNQYKKEEYQTVIDKVTHIKNKIKQMRTAGLEKGGEFSNENLVFKTLRRTEFMDILDSFKAKAYDKLLSVNETLTENIMKDLIRQRLHEAIQKPTRVIPYDIDSELKGKQHRSFSQNGSKEARLKILKKVEDSISDADDKIVDYKKMYGDNLVTANSKDGKKEVNLSTYLADPTIGNSYLDVVIYEKDGRVMAGHTQASGNMNMPKGKVTDVGYWYIGENHEAIYCKVAAGFDMIGTKNSIGASAAADAANKALVIFKDHIIEFFTPTNYTSDPETAAKLSAQKMTPKAAATKAKKDMEKIYGPISDFDWNEYRDKGILPKKKFNKAPLSVEPSEPTGDDKLKARKEKAARLKAKLAARKGN